MRTLKLFGLISTLFSVWTFAVSAAAVANIRRDVNHIESDLAVIASQVSTIDTAIRSFPTTGGSLTQALAIHTDLQNFLTSLKNAVSDVPSGFNENDGRTILNNILSFQPTLFDALGQIISKKPAFQSLPIGGVVALFLQDLQNLSSSAKLLGNALTAAAPSDLMTAAGNTCAQSNQAFSSAVAVYS